MAANDALARLAALGSHDPGLIAHDIGPHGQIAIARDGDDVVMVFCPLGAELSNETLSGVMARVDPHRPYVLKGAYTQAMLAGCLAFVPRPERVHVLGAGGGRLPLVLRHVVGVADVRGAELDGTVLALSQAWLGFANAPGLQIDEAEGRTHLAAQPAGAFDHIYVDCFTATGRVPPVLATVESFALCQSRLAPGGVMAINLLDEDPLFGAQKAAFCEVFSAVWSWEQGGLVVLFGTDAGQGPVMSGDAEVLGFDPASHVDRLRRVSALTLTAPPLREAALFDRNRPIWTTYRAA